MKITSFKIKNFRNYDNIELNFDEKLNIIYGNNGMGKTNLVEALYVLAMTKSFRTNEEKSLIKFDKVFTKIEGEVKEFNNSDYQVVINKNDKKLTIDNNVILKSSEYVSNILIVILEPNEHIIFDNSPSDRRKLLNISISQTNKDYINYLNLYNKILKQRNLYLKKDTNNSNNIIIDILTNKLIEYGLYIYNERKKFIENINLKITEYYNKIFEGGSINIIYNSDYLNKSNDDLIKIYKSNLEKDKLLNKTNIGIHHDDIIFYLDDKKISDIGSNGQKKNCIFSYKLALLKTIFELTNRYPILILDDLFSALDINKVENILKILDKNIQTFITTTDIDGLNINLKNNGKIFKVDNGTIEEVIL